MKLLDPTHSGPVRALVVLTALLLGAAPAADAVTVTPSALYIDHRTRSGALTLHNPGPTAEEIEISFAFGYARSDERGNVRVVFLDSVPEHEPSAVPFLRAFPRRLRLEPGQRQLVRILVQPPAELPEGEYWARVMVAARGGQPPVEQRRGEVTLQLEVKTVFAVALNYRHGTVSTGVAMRDSGAERGQESLDLLLDLERHGNAAFLGQVHAEVLDGRGRVVARAEEDIAVYRRVLWRVSVPIPEDARPGPGWSIRYRVTASRAGSAPGEILPAASVDGVVPLP